MGTGGGVALLPVPVLLTGGGSGGGFLKALWLNSFAHGEACTPPAPTGLAVLSLIVIGPSSLTGDAPASWLAILLTRFATSYFLFNALAPFQPVAACSPCRSRKLLAVAAELRASESVIEEGSFRNCEAVWRAACFWAKDVPWDGGGGWGAEEVVEGVVSFPKRDWRPLMDGLWAVVGLDEEGVFELDSLRHGFEACEPPSPPRPPPMPKPGTEMPAFPSRPKAPWLR